MNRRTLSRLSAALLIFASTLIFSPGCGILFHPERGRDHENSGRLAFGSLILDCLWLIVGVVPGVVALVIDFASGGAFLSYDEVMDVNGIPHNYCVKKVDGMLILTIDGRPLARIAPASPLSPERVAP